MTNQQGITKDEFAKLSAPFAAKDHEFNRGFIYIEETAICARIEEVDFSWEWKTVEVTRESDVAYVVGALTINGITRYGTGQQVIQRDAKGGESVGEATKGATTDAMKRAARLFGIGRYLLQCPKSVTNYGAELDKWLKSIAREQSAVPAAPAPVHSKAADLIPAANTTGDMLRVDDAERFPRFLAWAQKAFGMNEQNAMDALFAINGQPFKQATSEQAKDACEAWFFANKDAS
jgi:hypothetical protein